jgi:glutathione S-transferase
MTDRIQLYGDSISGNCYKLQHACRELGIDYDWHEVDILAGDTQSRKFLAMNPNGKVPLMALPDGRCLPESNAILSYLAHGSDLAGDDRFATANILQWLFFEQYSHEPFIATSRFIVKYLGSPADRQDDLAAKQPGGYKALAVMEQTLAEKDFIANDAFSIADIALYAYTHVAHEGGFDLSEYPALRLWLQRIEARPRYVAMRAVSAGH